MSRSRSAQSTVRMRLVGKAEALQHHGLDGRVVVERQLHVGEHALVVAVGDEQRAPLAGRDHVEAVPVDEADTGVDRIDPEPHPGEVEERERRNDLDGDAGGSALGDDELDGALEHRRRPGDGVEHRLVAIGG